MRFYAVDTKNLAQLHIKFDFLQGLFASFIDKILILLATKMEENNDWCSNLRA